MSEMKRSVKRLVRAAAAAVPMFQVRQKRREEKERKIQTADKQKETKSD